ncbi:hypothetical protein EIN_177740 [Entamoeba invadens IP1]|uniref:hypothetical protein n=1 Tax=Entamoeba invadens IP1 TaxID=370355 RepID=UPI0002C3F363|nr:hypothetical protein EIN_177740 [Entamoeba invadens IP1]ELP93877.1 hypothetical protein EIN_177740 [Entamoeba invadens IP1]|eukprot:XP_004260648.1 hypothetical protein EIN_177740 [Entamoeba invadens IP1]
MSVLRKDPSEGKIEKNHLLFKQGDIYYCMICEFRGKKTTAYNHSNTAHLEYKGDRKVLDAFANLFCAKRGLDFSVVDAPNEIKLRVEAKALTQGIANNMSEGGITFDKAKAIMEILETVKKSVEKNGIKVLDKVKLSQSTLRRVSDTSNPLKDSTKMDKPVTQPVVKIEENIPFDKLNLI